MALEDVQKKHQRLSMLLALDAMEGYQTNHSMLQCACRTYGHNMSNDKVRTHLAWLNEQGLVKLEEHSGYTLATLTKRGQEVSEGVATCPGVKKPSAK